MGGGAVWGGLCGGGLCGGLCDTFYKERLKWETWEQRQLGGVNTEHGKRAKEGVGVRLWGGGGARHECRQTDHLSMGVLSFFAKGTFWLTGPAAMHTPNQSWVERCNFSCVTKSSNPSPGKLNKVQLTLSSTWVKGRSD